MSDGDDSIENDFGEVLILNSNYKLVLNQTRGIRYCNQMDFYCSLDKEIYLIEKRNSKKSIWKGINVNELQNILHVLNH